MDYGRTVVRSRPVFHVPYFGGVSAMSDMQTMLDFNVGMLNAVCEFLMTPPVFYLFGLICFILVCKAVKIIMR